MSSSMDSGLTFEQYRIVKSARQLLTTLRETMPRDVVDERVEQTRTAVERLIAELASVQTNDAIEGAR